LFLGLHWGYIFILVQWLKEGKLKDNCKV